ncbi:TetR/AcrR family transcriptional regulator [Actinomadura decatromicini]|uniref:TetR/AcrR family transcriptional regulator n=1 Tax=Actinomadura decatromicini TaxID=2604572 RepID=A0A5D3FHZ8_9ACTN|nr:TetR/AcrR family transcriptional regulator [Actinomadura decatromicini]TYK47759.1 TetR/AcrR family transcriptional regulator [Actinomadura decatromicini]
MAGRPRLVGDTAILRAAVEVIGRVGPARLTLAAVAEEAGVVPGTLVQRFGSKRGLLLALADRSVRETQTSRQDREGTALAALRAFAVESMSEMATPERYANHLAFLCLDLTDPEFHERALAVHRANGRLIEGLLGEAADAGELRPGTDAKALAGTVQAVLAGAGLTWALDREGTLAERLGRELDAALSPHVP